MKPDHMRLVVLAGLLPAAASAQSCPDYSAYSQTQHDPLSAGKHALSSARPAPRCRTFNSTTVEELVANVTATIADPDLARLFANTYPNTLDTAIRWRGHAASDPAEELAFLITGDIDAMWLRDSANQLQSYLPVLEPDDTIANPQPNSIASLFRGVINLQSRALLTSPFCNAFQPPPESGIPPTANPAADTDRVSPAYDSSKVFECKFELDSLAAFLQLSVAYYESTHDAAFFGRFSWLAAVRAVLDTAWSMTAGTYDPASGAVRESPYSFSRLTTRATETVANDGLGAPVAETGLVRSVFRPSDDSGLFGFLVPANMMLARYLASASLIVDELGAKAHEGLADEMRAFSIMVRQAVQKYGIVPVVGANGTVETVYAYEVDGYGSAALMDDANVPSLLAAPLLGFLADTEAVYRRTRARLLSPEGNPYYTNGSVISGIGSPHVGPGMVWPMASIVRILTSEDDAEIVSVLRELVGSTDGLGLMHESVNSNNASQWTRQW